VIVQFRPLEPEDGDQVLAWRNSPDVAAYMYADHVITAAEHALWLEAALTKDDRRYWIIEADGIGVGVANLAHIDRTVRRCELGHYIADPQMRGKGVGACVEYILLQQVFQVLKLNKLWCEVLIENEDAWRLHESFGFVREARFRDHVCKGGRFRDVVGLGMLMRDWTIARPACEARLVARGFDVAELRVREV
jgi:UDP-4-amino-4,6-dideoxy-N-acetyl-beta-L-altrosamine N-acetyltransferase